MLLIADTDRLDADLAAGVVACRCGGRLRPWGYGTTRRIRLLSASSVQLRPRCNGCLATHVLLPAWCGPRPGDAAEVTGAALMAKAADLGHPAIAARLGRPVAAVRAWLRRTRDDQLALALPARGHRHGCAQRRPAQPLRTGWQHGRRRADGAGRRRDSMVSALSPHSPADVDLVVVFTGGLLLTRLPNFINRCVPWDESACISA